MLVIDDNRLQAQTKLADLYTVPPAPDATVCRQ